MRSEEAATLRVDHEWPAIGVEYDDAIFNGEGVYRESVYVPLAYLDRFSQCGRDREGGGAGDGLLHAEPVPVSDTVSTEVYSEGSQVSHHS